jgi:hypothetical protein
MKELKETHNRAHNTAEGKLHKLANFVMPLKFLASGIFTGFMILYMVSGTAYSYFTGEPFEYAVPFVFVLQGLLLAVLISFLYGIFLSDTFIKKWRFFPRMICFKTAVFILVALCFMTFVAIPMEWAFHWLATLVVVSAGFIIFLVISEIRFKATGRRYTEILKNFQSGS